MNILVTGANGFVGKNLVETLKIRQGVYVTCFDIDSTDKDLDVACKKVNVKFESLVNQFSASDLTVITLNFNF